MSGELNMRAFDWRACGGTEAPYILHGNRLFSVGWGDLKPSARAIAPGVAVTISTGLDDREVVLTGPQTVAEVMDALLKTCRGEPLTTVYKPGATDSVRDCRKCPRVGFCGWQAVPRSAGGGAVYRALWSKLFCHAGVAADCSMINPSWFVPEAATNRLPPSATAPPAPSVTAATTTSRGGGEDATKACAAAGCGAPSGTPLLLCGACRGVAYCGHEHQKAHWPEHREACRAAAAAAKAAVAAAAAMM